LYPAQERFLREALTLTPSGRLPYPEVVFSAPKKSGKTATAALAALYVICVLGGRYAECYCVANDYEQATSRVFQAISRIIIKSPMLRELAKLSANKIEFTSTGSTIIALASDYAGAAGANPTIVLFDELWGYTSERSQRLWEELNPGADEKNFGAADRQLCGLRGRIQITRGPLQSWSQRRRNRAESLSPTGAFDGLAS
jgi:hypothetical protein